MSSSSTVFRDQKEMSAHDLDRRRLELWPRLLGLPSNAADAARCGFLVPTEHAGCPRLRRHRGTRQHGVQCSRRQSADSVESCGSDGKFGEERQLPQGGKLIHAKPRTLSSLDFCCAPSSGDGGRGNRPSRGSISKGKAVDVKQEEQSRPRCGWRRDDGDDHEGEVFVVDEFVEWLRLMAEGLEATDQKQSVQIDKDVHRSFNRENKDDAQSASAVSGSVPCASQPSSGGAEDAEAREATRRAGQKQCLSLVLKSLFFVHRRLYYAQGFHDVVSLFLKTFICASDSRICSWASPPRHSRGCRWGGLEVPTTTTTTMSQASGEYRRQQDAFSVPHPPSCAAEDASPISIMQGPPVEAEKLLASSPLTAEYDKECSGRCDASLETRAAVGRRSLRCWRCIRLVNPLRAFVEWHAVGLMWAYRVSERVALLYCVETLAAPLEISVISHLRLLGVILEICDPDILWLVRRATQADKGEPAISSEFDFTISWMLTYFTHVSMSDSQLSVIWDEILASGEPFRLLYIAAAVVRSQRHALYDIAARTLNLRNAEGPPKSQMVGNESPVDPEGDKEGRRGLPGGAGGGDRKIANRGGDGVDWLLVDQCLNEGQEGKKLAREEVWFDAFEGADDMSDNDADIGHWFDAPENESELLGADAEDDLDDAARRSSRENVCGCVEDSGAYWAVVAVRKAEEALSRRQVEAQRRLAERKSTRTSRRWLDGWRRRRLRRSGGAEHEDVHGGEDQAVEVDARFGESSAVPDPAEWTMVYCAVHQHFLQLKWTKDVDIGEVIRDSQRMRLLVSPTDLLTQVEARGITLFDFSPLESAGSFSPTIGRLRSKAANRDNDGEDTSVEEEEDERESVDYCQDDSGSTAWGRAGEIVTALQRGGGSSRSVELRGPHLFDKRTAARRLHKLAVRPLLGNTARHNDDEKLASISLSVRGELASADWQSKEAEDGKVCDGRVSAEPPLGDTEISAVKKEVEVEAELNGTTGPYAPFWEPRRRSEIVESTSKRRRMTRRFLLPAVYKIHNERDFEENLAATRKKFSAAAASVDGGDLTAERLRAQAEAAMADSSMPWLPAVLMWTNRHFSKQLPHAVMQAAWELLVQVKETPTMVMTLLMVLRDLWQRSAAQQQRRGSGESRSGGRGPARYGERSVEASGTVRQGEVLLDHLPEDAVETRAGTGGRRRYRRRQGARRKVRQRRGGQ